MRRVRPRSALQTTKAAQSHGQTPPRTPRSQPARLGPALITGTRAGGAIRWRMGIQGSPLRLPWARGQYTAPGASPAAGAACGSRGPRRRWPRWQAASQGCGCYGVGIASGQSHQKTEPTKSQLDRPPALPTYLPLCGSGERRAAVAPQHGFLPGGLRLPRSLQKSNVTDDGSYSCGSSEIGL